jgi:tetratricopeptide (TPR) repeat protein
MMNNENCFRSDRLFMRLQRPYRYARHRTDRTGCVSFVALTLVIIGIAGVVRERWLPLLRLPTSAALPALADVQRALSLGQLEAVIQAGEQLMAANGQDYAALEVLVRALVYYSETDLERDSARARALELTTQALRSATIQRDVLAIHAFALYANGQHEEAVKYALRAVDRNSQNALARVALAGAYASTGLFEAGLREANVAVELSQTRPELSWEAGRVRAFALARLGRYQEALAAAEDAIRQRRSGLPLYFERALYALQLGDYNAATSAYFTVLAYDSHNVKARFRLCELSSQRRETQAALNYCTEVTERAPSFSTGWYMLGREYYLQGQFRLAQQALRRCSLLEVEQRPVAERRFECWYFQGQAAEILGDCPSLLAIYEEFQQMTREADLPQRWVYPPEGPAICQPSTPEA